jgi:hypothetical protein
MVRYLLLLTWLLISLTKANNVQANCYAGSWSNGQPVYGSLFVSGNTTLAQCQALACQIYPSISPSCPQAAPACQVEVQTQSLSCPANHTGGITQTNTKNCPSGNWSGWVTTSNTCVANPITCTYQAQTENRSCPTNFSGSQTWKKETNCPAGSYGQPSQTDWFKIQDSCTPNPPTCQVSSQLQTLQCPTGFTGSITQTRSSMCPDPYGSPTWQPWVTTSDTCKKSINNPTNPASPVSPLSPASSTSAPTTQSSPVTAPTPNSVPNSAATPTTSSTETSDAPTAGSSATTESAPTSASGTTTDSQTTSTTPASQSPPKGKTRSVVGLVLSLELFVKPGLQQANVFPDISIVKGIPNEILTQDLIMMDLLQQPSYNQPFDAPDLGFEQ